MKLVFATNNQHKLEEIRASIGDAIELLSLKDINCNEELPETQSTIEGNALQKAQYVYDTYGYNCFADDTGLEIVSLNGEPGVYSARWAGPGCSANDNVEKALLLLKGVDNRDAVFRTVISLIIDGHAVMFEGAVEGEILEHRTGDGGFGYDPVFRPKGKNISFAQMSMDEKNEISHRGRAVKKLIDYLHFLS